MGLRAFARVVRLLAAPRRNGLRFVRKERLAKLAASPKWQVADCFWAPADRHKSLPSSVSLVPAFLEAEAKSKLNPKVRVVLCGEWRENAWRARVLAALGYRVWLTR